MLNQHTSLSLIGWRYEKTYIASDTIVVRGKGRHRVILHDTANTISLKQSLYDLGFKCFT